MIEINKVCNSLVITEVEKIQETSNEVIKSLAGSFDAGAYICLNRPQHTIKRILGEQGIELENIFFIDCISSSLIEIKKEENVMHISNPADLTGLSIAISEFIKRVPGKKYILLDALGTLLIYNQEDVVIKFVRTILEESSRTGVCTVMLTPKTDDDVLAPKIIPFFDNVVKEDWSLL